jgi:hypothetical protein
MRWRIVAGVLAGVLIGSGWVLGAATSASAAPAGHWGAFALSGSGKQYVGTVTLPGFPATTFASDSRQSSVVSGASTWQGPSTGPGEAYGSSRANTYLNQRPSSDAANPASASTTTYSFAEPTPGGSSWVFVLGDIDADQATIAATVQGGGAATAAQLGYQGSYNSCSAASAGGWSCPRDPDGTTGQDVPTWEAGTRTLVGNAGAEDTAGASAWFSPTVPLTSLTIMYQQRSGFPVYQTWFANRTAALSGIATLDGSPIPGVTVTATAPQGAVYTTTTDAQGRYAFPELPVIADYRVDVAAPSGATGASTVTGVSLNDAPGGVDQTGVDFPFRAPSGTTSVIGTVTDRDGDPASNLPVAITDPASGATLVDTTTNSDGVYTGSGLPPATDLEIAVDGGTPTRVTTGEPGSSPLSAPNVVADAVATISGLVSVDGRGVPGTSIDLVDGSGSVVATTTTTAAGEYTFVTVPGAYTVRSAIPAAGVEGTTTIPVDTTTADATAVNFPFVTPQPPVPVTVTQPGVVWDAHGNPVPGVVVTATPHGTDSGSPVTATTDSEGRFNLVGLNPTTSYTIVAAGGDPETVVTPASGSGKPITLTGQVIASPSPTPTPTPSPSPTVDPTTAPGPVPSPAASGAAPVGGSGLVTVGSDGALAYTGADVAPALIVAGLLIVGGVAVQTVATARKRAAARRLH